MLMLQHETRAFFLFFFSSLREHCTLTLLLCGVRVGVGVRRKGGGVGNRVEAGTKSEGVRVDAGLGGRGRGLGERGRWEGGGVP
jgi:hypothetical protein